MWVLPINWSIKKMVCIKKEYTNHCVMTSYHVASGKLNRTLVREWEWKFQRAFSTITKIVLTLQTPWKGLRDPQGSLDHCLRITGAEELALWVCPSQGSFNCQKLNGLSKNGKYLQSCWAIALTWSNLWRFKPQEGQESGRDSGLGKSKAPRSLLLPPSFFFCKTAFPASLYTWPHSSWIVGSSV